MRLIHNPRKLFSVKLIELPKPMVQIAVTHCIGSLYCTPVPINNDGE